MAELAVTFLIGKLAALAEEEIRMLRGVRKEIENIREEFQSIKVLLRNADSKADIDEGVKEWVAQVREAAYEIEDILDTYFLNRFHDVSKRPESSVGSINDIFRKIRGLCKCIKSQHKIGNELIDIKGRILEISSRKERYQFSNLDVPSSSTATTIIKHDPRVDALFLEESELFGTEGPREELIGNILEANAKLLVLWVHGEGGLGKTTVVKKVFDSPQVREQFSYRAWLTISQTPDSRIILKDLLKQMFPHTEAEDSIIRLKQQLNDNLRGKKYVVVLDDIWTVDAWKELKNALPDDNESGSRILVTTRNQEVANACLQGCDHTYSLGRLNSDHSWRLFYMKACSSRIDDMGSYPEDLLKDKAEKFLKKCCGLPLAIVAMGGLLSTKRPAEWDQVYETLGSLPLKDLNWVISLSFNDLPYYLKSCFLYLCMFPEDYVIKSSRLLRLWTALRYVETNNEIDVSIEEMAKSYLHELIQRSLIQVVHMDECKRVVTCKIHDVMRDFIVEKARNQKFAQIIAWKLDEHQFWNNDDIARKLQQPRHLSICTSEGSDDAESNILFRNNNRLVVHSRSLLVFPSSTSTFSMAKIFLSFRLLNVLDLESAGIRQFPDEVINLFHLRYLSLRRSWIRSLPNTLGKLVNLETLDMKHTHVKELPVEILKLKQLRNLLFMRDSFDGVDLPVGIGCLTNLQNLNTVSWNEDVVKELGMLTRLRKLSINPLRDVDGKQLFASIERMKCLSSLKVKAVPGQSVETQSLRSPPRYLQRLYIKGVLKELPNWFFLLENLEMLTLWASYRRNDLYGVLQSLPNLVILILRFNACVAEELRISKSGFPRLKKLILGEMWHLSNVEVEQGGMPVIQLISFMSCGRLENIPHGINHLHTLQTIHYYGMPDTFVDQLTDHQTKLRQKDVPLQVRDGFYNI